MPPLLWLRGALKARCERDRSHVTFVGGDDDAGAHPVQEARLAHTNGVGPRPFPRAYERPRIQVRPIRRVACRVGIGPVLRDELGAGSRGRVGEGILDAHDESRNEIVGAVDIPTVREIAGAKDHGGDSETSRPPVCNSR